MTLFISILAFIFTAAFFVLSAIIDSEHLKDGDWIEDHTSRLVQRVMYCMAIGLINPWYFLAGLAMLAGIFDQSLNILMNNDFWHLGKTAKWDLFWRRNKKLYKATKWVFWVISILLFSARNITSMELFTYSY